jgi:hypothetical protein
VPSLNPRQFAWQEHLTGFLSPEVSPQGFGARRREQPYSPPPPQSTHKRGEVGQGQQIMNFDAPNFPLETAEGGLIPVDSQQDPAWDRTAWRYGGAQRMHDEYRREVGDPVTTSDEHTAHVVTTGWQNAPVETFGPDAQIRTNQGRPQTPAVGNHAGFPAEVDDLDEDKVGELRDEGDLAFLDPQTSEERFPWVAQVEGKNYLMEGHHRAVAARTRDSGEFPAHVLRGANWGQIEEQLYDGPRGR